MLNNRGVWPAWLWMFILAILLGWLPFIGPAIAGFIGGVQAGDVGSALIAAIIPSLIAAVAFFVVGTVFGFPIVAALVGTGLFMVLVIGTVPLLVGAWLGGMFSERRQSPPVEGA
jgi:uncharacterized membrane protein YvlD (DUF360 family)